MIRVAKKILLATVLLIILDLLDYIFVGQTIIAQQSYFNPSINHNTAPEKVIENEESFDPGNQSSVMGMRAKFKKIEDCKPGSNDPFCNIGDLNKKTPLQSPVIKEVKEKKAPEKLSIIDIQPFSTRSTFELKGADTAKGKVELVNLNTNANRWYVLHVKWPKEEASRYFHLETLRPKTQRIVIDDDFKNGIVIVEGENRFSCKLWSKEYGLSFLNEIKEKPYTPLCSNKIYLRQKIEGYRTTKEWVVEFLRDNIWGGEAITDLVKSTIYKDRYLIDAKISNGAKGQKIIDQDAPAPARVSKAFEEKLVAADELGISIKSPNGNLMPGHWYPAKYQKGVYLSVLEAEAVHEDILKSHKKYVKLLGPVEKKAVNYLIAFDLSKFQLNFSIGTEHPRVGWSARVRESERDISIPGPDGIGDIDPIATTGLIPPSISKTVAATFTGGFKRSHGAFKWGRFAKQNFGTHYGFMENGVIFSSLQNGLATLTIDFDGRVRMKTWTSQDNENLDKVLHARQNGMPVIKFDQEAVQGVPGKYVSNWTMGNWSGSQDRAFRTLRAGVCLKQQLKKQFLIYGYFSSVTPTAMARIFQAYGCDYGMHLDMNALEHTYLAVYPKDRKKGGIPEQLVKGMKVLDERFKGNVPRFIGYPDNRDYFYLTPKEEQ